jgi:hypothetical protein
MSVINRKKYTTLPQPPQRPGRVSNRTAIAATIAIAGSQISRKGERRGQITIRVSSPRMSCAPTAARINTTITARNTVRLLSTLPRI